MVPYHCGEIMAKLWPKRDIFSAHSLRATAKLGERRPWRFRFGDFIGLPVGNIAESILAAVLPSDNHFAGFLIEGDGADMRGPHLSFPFNPPLALPSQVYAAADVVLGRNRHWTGRFRLRNWWYFCPVRRLTSDRGSAEINSHGFAFRQCLHHDG